METLDCYVASGYAQYLHQTAPPSNVRRSSLRRFAGELSNHATNGVMTDLEAFVGIASYAAIPFSDSNSDSYWTNSPFKSYLEDLRRVLIGDGFIISDRNSGKYALAFNAFHDSGFKTQFQDGGNQVQHAMAGIYISALYGFAGRKVAYWRGDDHADLALYKTAFDIGDELNEENFKTLPDLIKERIGE